MFWPEDGTIFLFSSSSFFWGEGGGWLVLLFFDFAITFFGGGKGGWPFLLLVLHGCSVSPAGGSEAVAGHRLHGWVPDLGPTRPDSSQGAGLEAGQAQPSTWCSSRFGSFFSPWPPKLPAIIGCQLMNMLYFPLLVLNGIYHYWKHFPVFPKRFIFPPWPPKKFMCFLRLCRVFWGNND